MSAPARREAGYDDESTGDEFDQELSIDIPPESPLPSTKKSKKRKGKEGSSSKEKKVKKSRSSRSKVEKVSTEVGYEEGTDVDDEPPELDPDSELGGPADEDEEEDDEFAPTPSPAPVQRPEKKKRSSRKKDDSSQDTNADKSYGDDMPGSSFAKPKKSKKSKSSKKKSHTAAVYDSVGTPDSTAMECSTPLGTETEDADYPSEASTPVSKDKKRKSRRDRDLGEQRLTVDEVCSKHGINNVEIDYTDENFQTWTTYKVYTEHVRPMLLKDNPKVSTTRLVHLVAAKWREFVSLNPYKDEIQSSERSAKKAKDSAVAEADDDVDSDDGSTGGGKKDRSAKKTVAPLKIKKKKVPTATLR